MDIASYFLFSLVSGVCGVVLWHFPFILPLSFCMYAWYSLIFCIVNYKKKEALSDLEHSIKRNNYFKLVALIVEVSYVVLWKYIEEEVIDLDSFESYLNCIKVKHRIFHVYKNTLCCECKTTNKEVEKLISEKQFKMLYKYSEEKSLPSHKKFAGKKISQICLCSYSAVQNVSVRVLDITLANCLIKSSGKQALGLKVWMKTITEIRNEIFHHSDIQEMADDKFRRRWQKLEGSIMGIANLVHGDFAKDINEKIEKFKQLVVIPDKVLQHERLCRDYWKSKCAEFERMQMEEIKASTLELGQFYPGKTSGSHVFGSHGITQIFEQQDIPTTVEDQTTVPVLLQLEVPTSWNTKKIIKAVEQLRLSGNTGIDSGLKIKAISSDDLYIFTEIVKKVLRQSDKLRIEINQLMKNILTKAKIDTVDVANVNINMTIPKSKDLHVPTKAKFELKTSFQVKSKDHSRKCIITGNKIVLTKSGRGLQICKLDGTFDRCINLEKKPPVSHLLVIDCNTIAVSYNGYNLDVLDLTTGLVKHTLVLNNIAVDIAYQDGFLYIVEYDHMLTSFSNKEPERVTVMKLSGELIRQFFVSCHWCKKPITSNSKRFFSILENNAVGCYDLEGILQWKYQFDKSISFESIATYEDGQVFVADGKRGDILLLSADGKSFDVVLTFQRSKQINDIYYDKTLKLLVVYETNNIFLYQVNH